MKILIVNEYIGSPYHGMVYRNYYIARMLVERGHEVYMLSSSYTHLLHTPPDVNKNVKYEKIDGINYIWIKMGKYSHARSPKRLFNMLFFAFKAYIFDINKYVHPDVVIASSPSPFSIYPASLYAKRNSAQLIYEVRDIWPLAVEELLKSTSMSRLKEIIVNQLINSMRKAEIKGWNDSDWVVSVFPKYDMHMKMSGFESEKFRYIPNGFYKNDLSICEDSKEYIDGLISQENFNICYCGTLGRANALHIPIEAMCSLKEYKDIYFYIVGDGIEKEYLKKLSNGCPNVVFVEHLPKSSINYLYSKMDVLYIGLKKTKLFEFGISPTKLPEYMQAMRPVVTCLDAPENPVEISGCGICVESENAKDVAAAFLKLKGMSVSEREVLGMKGCEYVKNNLMYDTLTSDYEKLFK